MPVELQRPDPSPLGGHYLEVVVCQVRYEEQPSVADIEIGRALQDYLGGRTGPYPRLDRQEQQLARVELSPAGVSSAGSTAISGWRLRSSDGRWIISLLSDHVSLETTAYTTWQGDFRDRLEALLIAVEKIISPRAQERLGLRYINRLPKPASGRVRDWSEQVKPEFLGLVAHPAFRDGVISKQEQIELEISDRIQCVIRHGAVKEADGLLADAYLLDYDVYTDEPRLFEMRSVLELAEQFNEIALAVFQMSLTEPYLRELQQAAKHD